MYKKIIIWIYKIILKNIISRLYIYLITIWSMGKRRTSKVSKPKEGINKSSNSCLNKDRDIKKVCTFIFTYLHKKLW